MFYLNILIHDNDTVISLHYLTPHLITFIMILCITSSFIFYHNDFVCILYMMYFILHFFYFILNLFYALQAEQTALEETIYAIEEHLRSSADDTSIQTYLKTIRKLARQLFLVKLHFRKIKSSVLNA